MRGFLLLAVIVSASPGWGETPAAAPAPGCRAPEYRQFDFMLGEWDAAPAGRDTPVAQARWDAQGKGCSVQENWFPQNGNHGNSINYWDAADRKWHQHWVGADGDAVHYVGVWTGKRMEFRAEDVSTPQMQNVVLTMTFERQADGSVLQSGAQSTDGGKTFQPAWAFVYRKAAAKKP